MPIPYGRQTLDEPRRRGASPRCCDGDWLTQGPAVEAFEQAVADACDVPHAVAFSSGTAALHAAAFAAGVRPGDELVTSAITFAASANCGAYLGATPRFADIEADTWNVCAATIARAATDGTKVVVPVHFAGLPAPVARDPRGGRARRRHHRGRRPRARRLEPRTSSSAPASTPT